MEYASYSLGYVDGEYRMVIRNYDWKVPSYAPFIAHLAQGRVSVRARQVSGDAAAYGVVFVSDQVRAFLVSPLGYVALWRYDSSTESWRALRDWQASSAIAVGRGANALTVEMAGGEFRFYVNGIQMPFSAQIPEDAAVPMRLFGVIGASYSSVPMDCRFDDFEVRLLPEPYQVW